MNVPIDVNKSNLLAIIILNWNGSDDTAACTSSVLRAGHNPDDIIIVDNLSTDGTHAILKKLENHNNITVIYNDVDLGKSYSVRKAIPLCKGDLIIPQDADFEYNPKEYPIMIHKMYNENLDVVIGSRVCQGKRYHIYKINEWGIKFLTGVTKRVKRNFLYE